MICEESAASLVEYNEHVDLFPAVHQEFLLRAKYVTSITVGSFSKIQASKSAEDVRNDGGTKFG